MSSMKAHCRSRASGVACIRLYSCIAACAHRGTHAGCVGTLHLHAGLFVFVWYVCLEEGSRNTCPTACTLWDVARPSVKDSATKSMLNAQRHSKKVCSAIKDVACNQICAAQTAFKGLHAHGALL